MKKVLLSFVTILLVATLAQATTVLQTNIQYGDQITCIPGLVATFTGFNTAGSAVFYSVQVPGTWLLVRKIGTKWPFKYDGVLYYIVPMTDSTIKITQ